MGKRVAIYTRVSTDTQTLASQRGERDAVTERMGHTSHRHRPVRVIATGTSGETWLAFL